MSSDHTAIHLLAGGMGGTTGAVVTCPLEVVKTRLQSSVHNFNGPGTTVTNIKYLQHNAVSSHNFCTSSKVFTPTTNAVTQAGRTNTSLGLYRCLKHIVQTEGAKALFRGLGPNLLGVAPSRAIYFFSYAQAKQFFNEVFTPETPVVHILSASCAGFTASTATNPIWFVKTRLQLDQKLQAHQTASQIIRQTYTSEGLKGFYRGITASYYGITETVIHFVIYEAIKSKLREMKGQSIDSNEAKSTRDFVEFMCAGAVSKTIATCCAYPHEVARTRLREEGRRYKGFWQTLAVVFKEEGHRGLYRGLGTQLVRQIPNTAIMMSTYEAVVYLFTRHLD